MTTVQERPAATPTRPGGGRLHGLDLLRVLASATIVYHHVAAWIHGGRNWFPIGDAVNAATDTLHLRSELSFVGVALLLLISGIVVTGVSFRERPVEFLTRRVARVIPPMWAALPISFAFVVAGLAPSMAAKSHGTLDNLLADLWFGTYLMRGHHSILPITWSLLVQLSFYLFIALTIPLLRRRPWLPPAVAAAAISITMSLVPEGVAVPTRTIVAFLPIVFIGHVISLVWLGKIRLGVGLLLGAAHFMLFTRAELVSASMLQGGGYENALLIDILIVILCMGANGRIATARWVKVVGKRTYSVYLLHMPVTFGVMALLQPLVGTPLAAIGALLAMALAVEVFHRLVEMPVTKLVRRGLDRRRGERR
ncbi:acyltransferase family protein [Saccharothrix sp. HUAS TT1]|uniref:acyltransferase family protein n=1 Tax=unclassified Saccharothrix TaxID=2593673 RepID=UPI00345BAA00